MAAGPIWKYTSDPLSEKAIRHAERVLDVTFPADYRDCVRLNHGGAPEPDTFVFTGSDGQPIASRVGLLLSLNVSEDENVVGTAQLLDVQGKLPAGLVPIIDDGGGNFVCLDYRAGGPKVAFLTTGGEVRPVAESFGEFLGMLH